MTVATFQPDSLAEFGERISSIRAVGGQIVIRGSMSKIKVPESKSSVVSTARFSGIVDHQASDFTITARAGTPVIDLVNTLKSAGQFLPFDPTFVERGATVGGLVASGLNGPCRLRYGGLRDFVIGCQFIGYQGHPINSGGRVVKNAAGFDLPKFMIGSGGRFGLLTEITFKVFPRPRSYQSLIWESGNIELATTLMQTIHQQLDFDALEISPTNQVIARFSGETKAVFDQQVDQLKNRITQPFERLNGRAEETLWEHQANFKTLGDNMSLVKVPINAKRIHNFDQQIREALPTRFDRRYSVAGNVAILSVNRDDVRALDKELRNLKLTGQIIVGTSDQFLIGEIASLPFLNRIKMALDPEYLFGTIVSNRDV